MPGITVRPSASMISASLGGSAPAPVAAIRSPAMTTVAFRTGSPPVPSINVAPTIAIVMRNLRLVDHGHLECGATNATKDSGLSEAIGGEATSKRNRKELRRGRACDHERRPLADQALAVARHALAVDDVFLCHQAERQDEGREL